MRILDAIFGKRTPKTDIKERFELLARVGQGTMSEFWRARDRLSGRQVGLKILDREQTLKFESRFPGLNKPTEGEVAIQLDHPGIVKTIEHGVSTDSLQFVVMEFIEGRLLSQMIRKSEDDLRENCRQFMIELAEATAYVHEKQFIHRDICPKNVIISEAGHVKLIDFGLVVPNTPEFRRPGNRTGTANYMAPELLRRRPTDERIDVFSLGVSCFEMLSGQLPWDPRKSREAVMQHSTTPARDIRELVPDIDDSLAETIMRGIAVDVDLRWSSAKEMAKAISC